CIVPCLVHILPPNSPLVHALRALQQFRTLVGMDCTLESRLQAQDAFVRHYEIACRIQQDLDKNFNFLKQHYTCHASSDIREKGATKHMSTRTGEGFQQEVTRHYNRTNGRDAERQMVVIDENEEAMARLDMLVADYEIREKQKLEDSEDHADNTVEPAGSPTAHWRFSAPNSSVNSRRFETEMSRGEGGEAFDGFDIALREFLAIHHPERVIAFEDTVMVQSFRAVHIEFQSMVNWSPQRDILRCNPKFYGRPRYDCVLYNAESDPLSLARLIGLLRCTIPGGAKFDLAFVYRFKNSKWKPRTFWRGCRVVEECRRPEFLPLEHVARGALLAHAWGTKRTNLFFPIDTIDDDMFLRLNKWSECIILAIISMTAKPIYLGVESELRLPDVAVL
ncbi:hypothetical protein B0H14DRAFT_2395645, partial [Mycena olivaceomarginata]